MEEYLYNYLWDYNSPIKTVDKRVPILGHPLICRALNFIEIYLKIFIKTLDFHIVSLFVEMIIS